MGFLLVGFLLMLLMRWQLAWPTSPLPPALAAAVGPNNAPGGILLPEFYNQLVAMHGTVDGLSRRRPAPDRRVRQLSRAVARRRLGHGVSATERRELLDLPRRRRC